MKYIIKNCPNFCNWTDNSCSKTWEVNSFNYIQCKEIDDCLLKQIVCECKQAPGIDSELSQRILDLMKIEECE